MLPATIACERIAIALRSQHNSNQTMIEALAVPEVSAVTSPPADGAITDIMRHCGMLPADACPSATTFQEDEISVLISSVIYWDVATGQITGNPFWMDHSGNSPPVIPRLRRMNHVFSSLWIRRLQTTLT
ncbi:hypothetical protein HPB50_003286 [Hyalomma asiaticum]|uniref:Uncharacterized protein n=1 Tax=Hyalomma asiaticum TaxID=266040 RepID=A0ACB7TAE0_HYAAI|nr:hypothetical protein HPB50_003286 [Hyalomma asiaticum]